MRKFESKKSLRKQIAELTATVNKYEKSWRRERDELMAQYEVSLKKTARTRVEACPRCGNEAYAFYPSQRPRCFTCNHPFMPEPLADLERPKPMFDKKNLPKVN